MRRLSIIITTIITVAIFIAGCAVNMSFQSGALAGVTADGRVTSDRVYVIGNDTYRFNADGTYAYEEISYEGTNDDYDYDGVTNEGWVLRYGDRGTYLINVTNRTIRISYTADFRQVNGSGPKTWDSLLTNAGDTIRELLPWVLTETDILRDIFISNDVNSWIQNSERTTAGGWTDIWKKIITVDVAASNFTRYYESYAVTNGVIVINNGSRYDYKYNIIGAYPADSRWEAGRQLTFSLYRTLYNTGSTYQSDGWSAYTTTNLQGSTSTRLLAHMGDFLVYGASFMAGGDK